jgi:hypothetical protein
MKWLAMIFVSFAISTAILSAQVQKPERTVKANLITSESNPRLQIELPKQVTYLGGDRWVLYDVADCEVHIFVEADAHKVVRRMYWVQFESYLPSKPGLKYDYASNPRQRIDGMDFYVKARFGPTDDMVKVGSDAEHVRQLIRAGGYTMPPGMLNVRLVHLPDEHKRQELMIIYAEDTAFAGVAWTDLLPGGKAADQWPDIQKALEKRAEKRIVLHHVEEK